MPSKLNCWEFRNCGREKGGLMAQLHGECPVSQAMKYDGLNGGVGAGRACWMVENSVCRLNAVPAGGNPCLECEFYNRVLYEEDDQAVFRFASCPSAV